MEAGFADEGVEEGVVLEHVGWERLLSPGESGLRDLEWRVMD